MAAFDWNGDGKISQKIPKADEPNRLPFVISFINIYAPSLIGFSPRLSNVSKRKKGA